MASGRNRPNPPPPAAPGSARQNEYFVPRDGIDREVITADVCRYLGNDALVRPGTYEHPDGRVTQGYFITAYRNLTSAMIQDLKADSARWDQERRAASRPSGNAAGGTMLSSHPNAVFVRSSNSPVAPSRDGYRNSETHQQRQYYGPSPTDASYGDAMAVDPPHNSGHSKYPGTGNSGYNGVNSGGGAYGNPRYEPSGAFPQAAQFAPQQQQQQGGQYMQPQQPPEMFTGMPPGAASMVPQPFAQRSPIQDVGQYVQGAEYRQRDPVSTTAMGSRPIYQTSGPGYPAATDYASYPPAGATAAPGYTPQPIDNFYGRGASYSTETPASIPAPSDYLASPAGSQQPTGYSTVAEQQQYGEPKPPPLPSTSSPSAQAQIPSSSGPTSSRRDRDQDRHRDRDRDRERDRDRDSDRHAAERHAHRHRTRP